MSGPDQPMQRGPNTHRMDAPSDVTTWHEIHTVRNVVTDDGRGMTLRDEWWEIPSFVVEEIEAAHPAATPATQDRDGLRDAAPSPEHDQVIERLDRPGNRADGVRAPDPVGLREALDAALYDAAVLRTESVLLTAYDARRLRAALATPAPLDVNVERPRCDYDCMDCDGGLVQARIPYDKADHAAREGVPESDL